MYYKIVLFYLMLSFFNKHNIVQNICITIKNKVQNKYTFCKIIKIFLIKGYCFLTDTFTFPLHITNN